MQNVETYADMIARVPASEMSDEQRQHVIAIAGVFDRIGKNSPQDTIGHFGPEYNDLINHFLITENGYVMLQALLRHYAQRLSGYFGISPDALVQMPAFAACTLLVYEASPERVPQVTDGRLIIAPERGNQYQEEDVHIVPRISPDGQDLQIMVIEQEQHKDESTLWLSSSPIGKK